jgi:hypothetical protein
MFFCVRRRGTVITVTACQRLGETEAQGNQYKTDNIQICLGVSSSGSEAGQRCTWALGLAVRSPAATNFVFPAVGNRLKDDRKQKSCVIRISRWQNGFGTRDKGRELTSTFLRLCSYFQLRLASYKKQTN